MGRVSTAWCQSHVPITERTATAAHKALERFAKASRRAEAAAKNADKRGTIAAVSAARRANLHAAKMGAPIWIDGRWTAMHKRAAAHYWKEEKRLKKLVRKMRG
jgi:hypothetical protein